ncbi:MAG: phosphoribulokinase [Gammaproteobacteria bacterium]|nr:phosphoribulokinase [Gammaproteobacteria bacterium]
MSIKHPIIAITGSAGAGTSSAQAAFADIFLREGINAVFVHGNSFRRYTPSQVNTIFKNAAESGHPVSHFGPETNYFDRLEGLFREYARSGTGLMREYVSTEEQAQRFDQTIGNYSPWEEIPGDTELLFYEGQHGGCIEATWSRRRMSESHHPTIVNERHNPNARHDTGVDIAQWVDLLIGVVPSINLEWIQKIHHDYKDIGRSAEATVMTILRRMPDYVRYITPQFSWTDINFQRIPLVDTSNPFITHEVASADESMVVIRFREPKKFDFPDLLNRIHNAFMSRPNTLVVPGGEMRNAMEIICTPLVQALLAKQRKITEI